MNDKRFDDVIKDKLEHHIPFEDNDVWSSFASKLEENEHIQHDDTFDNDVKNHLQSHRPPYNSEHWRMMKTEIVTIEDRKNTVFISKILELAAIFLIVFTITQLPYLNHIDDKKSVELYAEQTESTKSNIDAEEKSVVKPSSIKKSEKPIIHSIQDINLISNESESAIDKKEAGMTESIAISDAYLPESVLQSDDKILHEIQKQSGVDELLANKDPQSSNVDYKQNVHLDIASENVSPDLPNSIQSENDATGNESSQIRDQLVLSPIDKREFLLPESKMAMIIPVRQASIPKTTKIGLSLWTAKDVNLINTPFDRVYSLASYKKEALSNAYGLNISKQTSNIEIQTGLAYLYKEYQPENIKDEYGEFGDNYFVKSLNKISYDLISIPLNLKYHGIGGNGWSSYLMVGATLNMVANAEYDITEKLVKGKLKGARYIAPRLDQKPFIKGIFNGDSFRENYYTTIGFGFGIEKNIFNNTSIYFQPSYFRHILSSDIGIGPNKDKIHTSSLQVGVKTLIN